jgi:hypothetical protein
MSAETPGHALDRYRYIVFDIRAITEDVYKSLGPG